MPRDPSSLRAIRARPAPGTFFLSWAFLRILLLATMAIGGSMWALVRYYTHVLPSMVVPVTSASPAWPSDAGVIEAPEIEVAPGR